MFLLLPCDVRLIIYDLVLADTTTVRHSIQPGNAHFRLLHACRLVYYEARFSFHGYVSLRNEFQIKRFHNHISSSPETALSVRWADVANDGCIVETLRTGQSIPASQLHCVLAKLPCLEKLRVFDLRHYYPYHSVNGMCRRHQSLPDLLTVLAVPQLRYRLDFEGAMYPHGDHATLPHLAAYELYLDPSTRVTAFNHLPDDRIRSLRLSGECRLSSSASFPALRHLTLHSMTSNTFDKLEFHTVFAASRFESFTHSQGDRLGFQIRNAHLQSLVDGPGCCLRKLVLLGCTRLSTSVIASCLRSLPALEYFALSIVTVNELRENFILALGPCIRTLKLQVTHAWYAIPLFDEERDICNSLEKRLLSPNSSLAAICVSFYGHLMTEDGREERWKRIAHARQLTLKIGPWEDSEGS